MPLPLIIGGIAAVAGVAGVGTGIHGGVKMKEASDTMKAAKSKQEKAVALFERKNSEATELMDSIGKQELNDLLLSAYKVFDIKIPWDGDFDTFMGNKTNHLVFE